MKKYILLILCLVAITSGMQIQYKIPPRFPTGASCVLDMPLDSGFMAGVTVQDKSQGNNTGTAQGGTGTPVPSYPGFLFTAANTHHIGALDALLNTFPFTISCWFKTTGQGITVAASIQDKDVDDVFGAIGMNATEKGMNWVQEAGETAKRIALTATANDGVWHHYTAVFTSNISRTIYLDGGVEIVTGTDDRDPTGALDAWSIGALQRATPASHFDGNIGGVMIFARELSAIEIMNLYQVTRHKYGV